jgi:GNAT superfamily N-acetyltransferase
MIPPASGGDAAPNGVIFRRATAADVPAVVALLAGDDLRGDRETPGHLSPYGEAFARLDRDPRELLVVGERNGRVVATLQLSVLSGLSRTALTRAQLEGVHVAAGERGRGTGTALVEWAIAEARRRGCGLVQLTSDTARVDARRFYERLGFQSSHVGFKLPL